MTPKLDSDISVLFEEFVFANLPECEHLRENAKHLFYKYISLQNSGLKNNELMNEIGENIDLYRGQLPEIIGFPGVGKSVHETQSKIQLLGAFYIVALVAKNYGLSLKGIQKRLSMIEKAILNLSELIKLDTELSAIGGSIAISEIFEAYKPQHLDKPDVLDGMIFRRYQRLKNELEGFSELKEEFSESILAKWIQYGKSGPKEGSALNVLIEALVEVWVFDFNRTLTFSADPLSGREKFLTFAENCLDAIHPSVLESRPDTLRNAYEKLRAKGKFEYPTQNSS